MKGVDKTWKWGSGGVHGSGHCRPCVPSRVHIYWTPQGDTESLEVDGIHLVTFTSADEGLNVENRRTTSLEAVVGSCVRVPNGLCRDGMNGSLLPKWISRMKEKSYRVTPRFLFWQTEHVEKVPWKNVWIERWHWDFYPENNTEWKSWKKTWKKVKGHELSVPKFI